MTSRMGSSEAFWDFEGIDPPDDSASAAAALINGKDGGEHHDDLPQDDHHGKLPSTAKGSCVGGKTCFYCFCRTYTACPCIWILIYVAACLGAAYVASLYSFQAETDLAKYVQIDAAQTDYTDAVSMARAEHKNWLTTAAGVATFPPGSRRRLLDQLAPAAGEYGGDLGYRLFVRHWLAPRLRRLRAWQQTSPMAIAGRASLRRFLVGAEHDFGADLDVETRSTSAARLRRELSTAVGYKGCPPTNGGGCRWRDRKTTHFLYELPVARRASGAYDMFNEATLRDIKKFEDGIRQFTSKEKPWLGFDKLCYATSPTDGACRPPDTAINYFFPTQDFTSTPPTTRFDGLGTTLKSIPTVSRTLANLKVTYYMDRYFSKTNLTTSVLRSSFQYGSPGVSAKVVFTDYIAALFEEHVSKADTLNLRVMAFGDGFQELQIDRAIMHDAFFALGSLSFVWIYMIFHTGSVWTATMAMLGILLSFPVAYAIFRVVLGYRTMSLLNFLALFIILGIGADDVFVFVDTWAQSAVAVKPVRAPTLPNRAGGMKNIYVQKTRRAAGENLTNRLIWTYRHAGVAMLITTTTTTMSFFANIVSSIKVVREFGLFMGLVVIANYALIMLYFPAVVLCRELCCRTCWCCPCCCFSSGSNGKKKKKRRRQGRRRKRKGHGKQRRSVRPTPQEVRAGIRTAALAAVAVTQSENDVRPELKSRGTGNSHGHVGAVERSNGKNGAKAPYPVVFRPSRATTELESAMHLTFGTRIRIHMFVKQLRRKRLDRIMRNYVQKNFLGKADQGILFSRVLKKDHGFRFVERCFHNCFAHALHRVWPFIVFLSFAFVGWCSWRSFVNIKPAAEPPKFFSSAHPLGRALEVSATFFGDAGVSGVPELPTTTTVDTPICPGMMRRTADGSLVADPTCGDCEVECSGHGVCSRTNYQCTCDAKFVGQTCNVAKVLGRAFVCSDANVDSNYKCPSNARPSLCANNVVDADTMLNMGPIIAGPEPLHSPPAIYAACPFSGLAVPTLAFSLALEGKSAASVVRLFNLGDTAIEYTVAVPSAADWLCLGTQCGTSWRPSHTYSGSLAAKDWGATQAKPLTSWSTSSVDVRVSASTVSKPPGFNGTALLDMKWRESTMKTEPGWFTVLIPVSLRFVATFRLASLSLGAGITLIRPASSGTGFSPNVLAYTATVANATSSVVATATAPVATASSAQVKYSDGSGAFQASGTASQQIPLCVPGMSACMTSITVDARYNGLIVTYTVVITRQGPPTASPSQAPTTSPTSAAPTSSPTKSPVKPSFVPTAAPIIISAVPTAAPTSTAPTTLPSSAPSTAPTPAPTAPTKVPTQSPTKSPSRPTNAPTSPTSAPTTAPTPTGSFAPTAAPISSTPTSAPVTISPTSSPLSASPSVAPTVRPTAPWSQNSMLAAIRFARRGSLTNFVAPKRFVPPWDADCASPCTFEVLLPNSLSTTTDLVILPVTADADATYEIVNVRTGGALTGSGIGVLDASLHTVGRITVTARNTSAATTIVVLRLRLTGLECPVGTGNVECSGKPCGRGTGVCACGVHLAGPGCDVSCPSNASLQSSAPNCHGHGRCAVTNWTSPGWWANPGPPGCQCNLGWGPNNATPAGCVQRICPLNKGVVCSGHGSCVTVLGAPPSCVCTGGYQGVACQAPPCPRKAGQQTCNSNIAGNICNVSMGTCACHPDYVAFRDCSVFVSSFKVPRKQLMRVTIAWGLDAKRGAVDRREVDSKYPLGRAVYDGSFDLTKPAVQEAMLALCTRAKANPILGWREGEGISTHCPMTYFKTWVEAGMGGGMINCYTKRKFPVVPDPEEPLIVYKAMRAFLRSTPSLQSYVVWSSPADAATAVPKIRAMFAQVLINLNKNSGGKETLEWFDRWETFVAAENGLNVAGAGTVIQSSPVWVRVVMEREAIRGAAEAWALSNAFAFVCIFFFTGNLVVSIYVILSVTGIVACLLAFMTVWQGWPFGAIEAIALTIFVGFSVDYCLHLAHAYNEADYNYSFLKMRQSLTQTGVSVFSAAITTIGSAAFLLFCDIQIFVQMGLLIGCNTVLAILFSLGAFSALAMGCGPTGNCGTIRCLCRMDLDKRRRALLDKEQRRKQVHHAAQVRAGKRKNWDGRAVVLPMLWETEKGGNKSMRSPPQLELGAMFKASELRSPELNHVVSQLQRTAASKSRTRAHHRESKVTNVKRRNAVGIPDVATGARVSLSPRWREAKMVSFRRIREGKEARRLAAAAQ